MDHYEFHNKFTDQYGCGLMNSIARMDLNDEYIKIYSKWADEVGKPSTELDKMFGRGDTATLENCLEDCHTEVFRLVEEEFFSKLTRESAAALCNTLFIANSKIAICEGEPDLLLDDNGVAFYWNRFHPDEKPILKGGDYIV